MNGLLDTLAHKPLLGAGGSFGGWIGSVISTTPLFQFLSALFGTIIGIMTIVGMIHRAIKWLKGSD
jgi:hypothetical protein